MCLEWLEAHLQPGETLLDYGCGSGILAIAAKMLGAGLTLAVETWTDAKADFGWAGIDWFVAHQTSVVHIRAMAKALGVVPGRFPLTLPQYGNMGPAAVPFTLARHTDNLRAEDRILLLGIGSGLNTSYAEIVW